MVAESWTVESIRAACAGYVVGLRRSESGDIVPVFCEPTAAPSCNTFVRATDVRYGETVEPSTGERVVTVGIMTPNRYDGIRLSVGADGVRVL